MHAFSLITHKSLHLRFQSALKLIPEGLNVYRKWNKRADGRPLVGVEYLHNQFFLKTYDLSEVNPNFQ